MQRQIFPGGPCIVKMDWVGFAVAGESFSGEDDGEERGFAAPLPVAFDEQIEKEGPMRSIPEGIEEAPFLFIVS